MTEERKQELLKKLQRFLSQRERSRQEITKRIIEKGICEGSEVPALLAVLEDLGMIDDQRFARERARYRLRNGYGPLVIARELALLGVTRSIVDRSMPPPEEIVESIVQFKKSRDGGVDQNFLLRRGFPQRLIRQAEKLSD
ncbi:MAG: regulatory protein RecX [Spirochaetales bacterium]|nr:regulatory protein RecX [Spirochaetales bacterium]